MVPFPRVLPDDVFQEILQEPDLERLRRFFLDRLVTMEAEKMLPKPGSHGRDYYSLKPSTRREKLVNTFASMMYAQSRWEGPKRWTVPSCLSYALCTRLRSWEDYWLRQQA